MPVTVDFVTFRDGYKTTKILATNFSKSLKELQRQDPYLFSELVQICRNSKYVLSPESKRQLKERRFVQSSGYPNDWTRKVVLNVVSGDLTNLTVHLPVCSE